MLHRRITHLALLALLLLGLTACEDNPTGVGLDIGGFAERSGAPVSVPLLADSIEATSFDDFVGNQSRILLGGSRVPGAYPFSATAYVDFLSASRTADFRQGTVSRAVLYLEPSYVYGDTTSPVTFELRSLSDELDTRGATNDTTIAVSGPPIRVASVEGQNASLTDDQITFLPTDTLVAITLHQDWIGEFDAALRSEDFVDDFHGFQLAPVDPGNLDAVSGFDVTGIRLEVVAAEDTIRYPAGRTVSNQLASAPNFTKFERLAGSDPAADPFLVHDGVGTTFTFDFVIPDSLQGTTSLNRATLTLTADTSLLPAPVGFVQPPLQRFTLLGVWEDSQDRNPAALAEASVNDDGELVFSTRTSGTFFSYVRNVMIGQQEPFDHYRLTVPGSTTTVNYQVFFAAPDDDRRPRLHLTVVPIN